MQHEVVAQNVVLSVLSADTCLYFLYALTFCVSTLRSYVLNVESRNEQFFTTPTGFFFFFFFGLSFGLAEHFLHLHLIGG